MIVSDTLVQARGLCCGVVLHAVVETRRNADALPTQPALPGLLGLITSLLHGPEDEKYSLKGALTRVEVHRPSASPRPDDRVGRVGRGTLSARRGVSDLYGGVHGYSMDTTMQTPIYEPLLLVISRPMVTMWVHK